MATRYVVLRQHIDADDLWQEVGVSEGASDLSAIRSLLEKDQSLGEGVYRAVPGRSWGEKPHTLKPKVSWV